MKKTAVITGGSSGLGFALAELLGKEGYSIIIIARNQDKINKAVSSLSDLNITAKDCIVIRDDAVVEER